MKLVSLWKKSGALLVASYAVLLLTQPAFAQNIWPNKPIKLIVPFPPGGGTDTFARPLAAQLSKELGQQVVVDNKGGAGGTIGAAIAAKSPSDGYTIFMGAVHHTVAESIYKNLPYNLEKELIPIRGVAFVPDVLVVNNKLPVQNVRELIQYSKNNPGKVNYGSSGNGTTRHLAGEIFNKLTGASLVHVPYKGSGPAMTALIGGEVDLIFEGLGSAASYIRAGTIRPLAVTSPKRSTAFPDIPTMAEAGVPGFESISWYGFWVPAGTPQAIQDKIFSATTSALNSPEIKTLWANQGADIGPNTQKLFAQYVKDETEKWGKVAKSANVSID
ncbi:tripartite tricarboxylate transporter substrate binding protein [Polynucleobacter sp. MWH-UH23A]|uniref:Bug family tripartite tricarboxylate transporter substrate binding protein n=1 Tax=Polynucleobacter sp. MWH-UH23A TaxID=1855613 RepID=UPI003365204F